MKLDTHHPLWVALRAHLSPALKAFHVHDLEIAYTTEDGCVVKGTQYRDGAGLRVPRELIPQSLSEQLENFCKSFVNAAKLSDGEGVLSVSLEKAAVVLHHQPFDERAEERREEWGV
jgi:hypothetical protein